MRPDGLRYRFGSGLHRLEGSKKRTLSRKKLLCSLHYLCSHGKLMALPFLEREAALVGQINSRSLRWFLPDPKGIGTMGQQLKGLRAEKALSANVIS